MERVKEFLKATGQPINAPYSVERFAFRGRLMREECAELVESIEFLPGLEAQGEETRRKALADILKEMCDVIYVIHGTALAFGWDLDEAYDRVCRNNMTKTINIRKDPVTQKVLKPLDYKKVNLEDLVS